MTNKQRDFSGDLLPKDLLTAGQARRLANDSVEGVPTEEKEPVERTLYTHDLVASVDLDIHWEDTLIPAILNHIARLALLGGTSYELGVTGPSWVAIALRDRGFLVEVCNRAEVESYVDAAGLDFRIRRVNFLTIRW